MAIKMLFVMDLTLFALYIVYLESQAARALRHAILYSKAIGAGAYGKAHLWVHLDGTQQVVDRIVIKNFIAESKFAITEDSPAERISTEAYISQLLVPDGSQNFYTVPILACQPISGSTGGWRTYSPYYSLGNFETLVNKYTKDASLPELFLWFFFYRMAKAAIAMDETLRKDNTGPVIVHNDIKPDNIFLGSPGSLDKDADFVMYPPAYLGDGFFAGYSDSLLGLVHACLWCDPSHRIDPQSLLFLIENSMVKHVDDMQRWGTKGWITNKHNETLGKESYDPVIGSDTADNAEETHDSDEDDPSNIPTPKNPRKRNRKDKSYFSCQKLKAMSARAITI
ncbi:hypothetical protein QM012_005137 [Aureobasidium pullulans]|uniref:Protein kinase domain-containing protein n=1 Tax=Aureobasidium pullulans TaxID=5580 RepID=A0ABR0T5M4_AURPU